MKYVAFLRGINVGGKNKIKMETLREMFSALDYENVKSYINSGNVIFETRKTNDKKLAAKIETATLVSGYKSNRFNCLESSTSDFCN